MGALFLAPKSRFQQEGVVAADSTCRALFRETINKPQVFLESSLNGSDNL